ncbi:MAG: hypothetical protein HKN70_03140, partial [Gammaproteobacteria bacterium]|nr:hypothetical protein [Gammaproteobacteria bacterium]
WWRKWYKRNALDQSDSAGVDTAQFPLGVPGYGQLGNPADDIEPSNDPGPKSDATQASETLKTRVARRDRRIAMLKRRLKKLNKELKSKRGHRKKIRASSSARDMETSKKQLQEKDEIIAALEEIVTENREKWLHQDANEALLHSKIEALSTDLDLAMKLLDERQRDMG